MLDDAFISFRYAANLVDGHGLVFNVGERVEGYTNFLWVIFLAFGKWLGFDIPALARGLGYFFSLATLGSIVVFGKTVFGLDRFGTATAIVMLGTCAVFSAWGGSGMEVSMLSFLILSSVGAYCIANAGKNQKLWYIVTGLTLSLVCMTRPDGVLLVFVLFGNGLFTLKGRKTSRAIWWMILTFVTIFGSYFAWRYSYYGFLLPNTFYAKVGTTQAQLVRGLIYVGQFVWAVWPLLALAMLAVLRQWRRLTSVVTLCVAYVVIQTVYVILVGGDIMPAFRFFAPILPLLVILAGIGVNSIMVPRWIAAVVIVAVCGYNVLQMYTSPQIAGHIERDRVAFEGKEVGLWLKAHVPPGTLIATNTAGSIPYYSELPTIDMLGLNDVHIAHRQMPDMGTGDAGHEKTDGAYILSRHPLIIQFHSSLGSALPWNVSDRQVYSQPEFRELYEGVGVKIPSLDSVAVFCVRRDFRFKQ